MKASSTYLTSAVLMMTTFVLLFVSVFAAPMESADELDNSIPQSDSDMAASSWDAIDTAALRRFLVQLDAEESMTRMSRAVPPEGNWYLRPASTPTRVRPHRPYRTIKRQVRFRQCYFNPISCFRK